MAKVGNLLFASLINHFHSQLLPLTTVKNLIVVGIAVTLLTGVTLALVLSSVDGNDSAAAYPRQEGYHHYGYGHAALKPGQYAAGTIASLQNDESGNPTWIVSGHWKASLTGQDKVMMAYNASGTNQSASQINVTATEDSQQPIARFKAVFDMVMTNGSALHQHQIYNFTLSDISMPDNSTITYNGTATVTMREGPVHDVPVSAEAKGSNVISIWLDPARLDNHFGDTPIYGTIDKAVHVMK